MAKTLEAKKNRLYSLLTEAMEKPHRNPLLNQLIINNACARCKSHTPEDIPELERRLWVVEQTMQDVCYRIHLLEQESRHRMFMLEQRQELLAQVLVKLTKKRS